MALWLFRAGRYGQHEDTFFGSARICLTWEDEPFADRDPTHLRTEDEIWALVDELYPNNSKRLRARTAGQFASFLLRIKPGDWVVTPRKEKGTIAIGEVMGPAAYDASAEDLYHVFRPVKWLNLDIPRSSFDSDILYSLGAVMTVCQIQRNDAEARVRAMASHGWRQSAQTSVAATTDSSTEGTVEVVDLEQVAADQIAERIERHFKGHGLARIVAELLRAQGYEVHLSPEGSDKGVDILAAPGPMGFGSPRLCVQVKSGDSPVDRMTLDQLIGAMQNFSAEQGLLVAWSGFKSSVDRERAAQFFSVRLWNREDLVQQLLAHYEQLPAELRNELPLKRIWVPAVSDDSV